MEAGSINTTLLQSATVEDAMGPVHLVLSHTPVATAAKLIHETRGRALVVDTGDDSPSIFTEFDVINNAAEATVKGIEIETSAKPVPDLELTLNYAYLDATYDRFPAAAVGGALIPYLSSSPRYNPTTRTFDASGNRLPWIVPREGHAGRLHPKPARSGWARSASRTRPTKCTSKEGEGAVVDVPKYDGPEWLEAA